MGNRWFNMPKLFFNFFVALVTAGIIAILERINQGREDKEQQQGEDAELQHRTEKGAIVQNIKHIDGVVFVALVTAGIIAILERINQGKEDKEEQQGEDAELQHRTERGAIVQNLKHIDGVAEQQAKERICEYLPEELMIESILTRLPARTLAICCCVSKLWLNSIHNDSRFSATHLIQNQKTKNLVFSILNVSRSDIRKTFWFSLLGREKVKLRFFAGQTVKGIYEPVGFCNGLACTKHGCAPTDTFGSITIFNPCRSESLFLSYVRPTVGEYIYLCHGFGFDSLSQVYKAVIVFTSKANDEFLCMVITLGTMSWRKILTSTYEISLPLGSSPFPSLMVTRVSRTLCRQATFCGGDLFWRTKNIVGNNNNIVEMLLSFDLHNEKIQFIQLPTACTLTTLADERQDVVVYHLLEFKGYPCIAHSERITRSNNGHIGHRCNYLTGVCCCCYKVNMYILKDKDKRVWTREETFNVQIMDQNGLQPAPLCRYFDTSTATPPTCMLDFSDHVLLYWFNGERLIFYDLQDKYLKVVNCSRSYPRVFQSKMNENLERCIGDDDNIYCPAMDYQLHAQVENMVSLKTFIPKEAKVSEFDCADEMRQLMDNHIAAGWLTSGRNKCTFSVFF